MTIPPAGTTHIWTPPLSDKNNEWRARLPYYKKTAGGWVVFSKVTGWRYSSNPPEWFAEEKRNGYFVTRQQFNSPNFVPKKEVL